MISKGDTFLSTSRLLFDILDVNHSNTIDVQELVVLTRRLLKGQGKDTTSFGDLEKQSREAVAKHGDGETLSFEEFVQMLGTKPWNSVIETKSARDEILLKGAALRATSPGRSADTVRDRSPGKQLYSAAYKLFHEADTNHDGMLDEEELGMLLLMLRKRMGKPLQGLDRAKCVEHAIISMAAVDTTGIGRIGFEAFVKMLNAKPWCDVLDASTRSELSHVQRRNIAMLKDKEDPADSFLAKAEALFEDLDSDQDKVLNMNELVVLTCRLLEIQGRDGSCKTELEATASSALTTYGDGETLSFEEFVQMLGAKPWNSVVDSDQVNPTTHYVCEYL